MGITYYVISIHSDCQLGFAKNELGECEDIDECEEGDACNIDSQVIF